MTASRRKRAPASADRVFDEPHDPSDPTNRVFRSEPPIGDETLVGDDAPEHVEHRRGDRAILRGPPPSRERYRSEQRFTLTLVRRGDGRIPDRARLERKRRNELQDSSRDIGDVLEPESLEIDARLALEPAENRVPQRALAREVSVDGPFVHPGAPRHRPNSELAPVPGRELVQQLGAGGEDAPARRRGLPAPERAVVLAALSGRRVRCAIFDASNLPPIVSSRQRGS
jgi:hypothetical protein